MAARFLATAGAESRLAPRLAFESTNHPQPNLIVQLRRPPAAFLPFVCRANASRGSRRQNRHAVHFLEIFSHFCLLIPTESCSAQGGF
jgi:hypothetical protein